MAWRLALQIIKICLLSQLLFFMVISLSMIGAVLSVGDGVVRATGLDGVSMSEKVFFKSQESGIVGMVFNIEENGVSIVILGKENAVVEGDLIIRSATTIRTKVGFSLLGSIIDPFGNFVWNISRRYSCHYNYEHFFQPVEIKAPNILMRHRIYSSLTTGLKVIDSMIPIGKGQRELIIGDRQTGKTTIAVTAILNQRQYYRGSYSRSGVNVNWRGQVFCIYVAIGQKRSSVKRIYNVLRKERALDYTTIISATASDPASLQYIAPYSGCSVGEWFRDRGYHALVIYDDLSKHAAAYRQISLLLRRPPGREAYPGDVFYIHSRLLERAAQMSLIQGGGSLTALPIVETQQGDVSAYIPTNVISITDGQICLDKELFNKGIRPCINIGLSVSRVGSAAQNISMKQVSGRLKLFLSQYKNLEGMEQFSSDLDPAILAIIRRGSKLKELLKQKRPMTIYRQVISIYAGLNGYLDYIDVPYVRLYESMLFNKEFLSLIFNRYLKDDNFHRFAFTKVFFFFKEKDFKFFFEVFGAKSYYKQLDLWLKFTSTYFIRFIQQGLNNTEPSKRKKILINFNF